MAIRTPNLSIKEVMDNEKVKHNLNAIQWHSLKCKLVTPMYGGGVTSAVVDTDMPIRVTGIRGQLRFWWRLLAKQKWYKNLSSKEIRKKESELWGGMADVKKENGKEEKESKASLVFLRSSNYKNISVQKYQECTVVLERNGEKKLSRKNGNPILKFETINWKELSYALFPAQGTLKEYRTAVDKKPDSLLKEGLTWTLDIAFAPQITEKQQKQVWETIRWWASFGGVGSRTRRGLGALTIEKTDKVYPVPLNEIKKLGLNFKAKEVKETEEVKNKNAKNTNKPIQAWTTAIEKLQKFRQIGEGRNNYNSRSHWAEPDAIRDITEQSIDDHRKRNTQGNYFPRAIFGLPIIFKFANKDAGLRSTDDPAPTTLTAKYQGQEFERLASPLILRPYCDESGSWHSLALCLPQIINHKEMQLILKGDTVAREKEEVAYWDDVKGKELTPIKNNLPIKGDVNPLTAFLTYFAD